MEFLSSKDICKDFDVTISELNKACKNGDLIPDRVVPICNKRLFTEATVKAWLENKKK